MRRDNHEDVDADHDERPERVGLDGGQGGDQIDGGDGNPEPARKLVPGEDSETREHPAAPRGSLPPHQQPAAPREGHAFQKRENERLWAGAAGERAS